VLRSGMQASHQLSVTGGTGTGIGTG